MHPNWFKFVINPVIVLFAVSSFAQKSEKQLGLGTGLYYHSFKDASIATTSQTGGSMSLLLFFRINGITNRHHVQLVYAAPNLQSSYLFVSEQTGYLQYAYHRRIIESKNVSLFGGAVIEFGGSKRNYYENGIYPSYLNPFDDGETQGTLSPSLLAEISIGKDKFTLQSWIALTSFSVHYQSRFIEDRITDSYDLTKIDTRVSYTRFFSRQWEARFDYQFQSTYFNYQIPYHTSYYSSYYLFTTIYSQAHLLNVSLIYKIHGK